MTQHTETADGMEEEYGFDGRKRVSGISLCVTYSHFMAVNVNFWVIIEQKLWKQVLKEARDI